MLTATAAALCARIPAFEGAIAWMYRDTVGKTTTAIGLMLPDMDAALALPFQVGVIAATRTQIIADWTRLRSMPYGRNYSAGFYRPSMQCRLTPATMTSLLENYVAHEELQLTAALPSYAKMPGSLRLALLDMAYNLGINGLVHGFPHMLAAIESGNLIEAAAQSNRPQLADSRNQWTANLILGAKPA